MKCGIIGFPNVGKSTLFNTLINKHMVAAENYPFCTIDPTEAVVEIKDSRLNPLVKIYNPVKTIYSTVTFTDIAGIIKGASKGEGLGNKFLENIRQVDVLIHVVRCFKDKDIINQGTNALENIININFELAFADLDSISKQKSKLEKEIGINKKRRVTGEAEIKYKSLCEIEQILNENINQSINGKWEPLPKEYNSNTNSIIKSLNLLTTKPMLYVCNIDEEYNEATNAEINQIKEKYGESNCIKCSIKAESTILDDPESIEEYRNLAYEDNYNGIDMIIKSAYKLLNRSNFFTAGEKEVRSWDIIKGMTAPKAAGRIHSDFESGFIKAIVVKYDDFLKYKSIEECKNNGKVSTEGRDYIVNDGDIIEFKVR